MPLSWVQPPTSRVTSQVVGHAVPMARQIPEVVRAVAGLAATVLDEARKLPETLPGFPVRLLGLAMQQAMKVQQHYAGLVARGDELFTGMRGENEPGLATFDDDEPAPMPSNGFRDSAFDRAGDTSTIDETLTDAEVEALPDDPPADAVTAVVDELAEQVETGQQSIEELVEEAPAIEEILDEIAIDELVDQAPTLEETAPGTSVEDDAANEDAGALESVLLESEDSTTGEESPADTDVAATADVTEAEPTADVSTSVDVLTPDGEVATVDAAVTDEGVAAPETPAAESADADDDTVATTDAAATDTDTSGTDAGPAAATDESGSAVAAATGGGDTSDEDSAAPDTGTLDTGAPDTNAADTNASATPTDAEGGSEPSGPQAPGPAPVDGYDAFSIAQLRGRLRGYALSTVQDLLTYEEATRARDPYLRMLRNRMEKLEEQAIESSPLAPRGA
jgi:hypothetical protein